MTLRAYIAMSEPTAAAALLVVAVVCAGVLFFLPRQVAPLELPTDTLPAAEVAAVIRADAAAAREAPHSKQADALRALFLQQGRMERAGTEAKETYTERRSALQRGYQQLSAEVGEAAALRLRAEAVLDLEAALDLRLDTERSLAVVGALSAMLLRAGASRAGQFVAPRFVVRTFQKARWNLLHGLAPDYRLVRVERRAYYGWKALHAERVPLDQRVLALHEYSVAGGEHAEEALGVLLFRLGDARQAADALQIAYARDPSLRLRNYLAAARASAAL